jgi:ubiquinone/menaquinone biosynthesis C-methylase UbiE
MTRWLFEVGAGFYAWMTAQQPWRHSCGRLVERLPAKSCPLRIVDLGCGPGAATFELARHRPQDSVSGVDIAGRMLRRAQRQARAQGLTGDHLSWVQADATQLPFKTESIDAITGHSVLYLLDDPGSALAECRRVLRSGGRLVVMEPSDRGIRLRDVLKMSADPRFVLSIVLWRPVSWLKGRFCAEALMARVREAGFTNCQVYEALNGLGLIACAQKT